MSALTFEQIRERLAGRFGEAVGPTVAAKDPFVVVRGEQLLAICRFLHDDPELKLDYLLDATAVDDLKENKLRVVYHLWSMALKHNFKLKVELDRAAPAVSSVESVWRAANWLEREVFDLFGVKFEGHPDLRRIMMPEDWQGHPLRKDWQEFGGYHGIGNTRASTLDLHLANDKKLRPPPPPAPPPAPVAEAKPADAAAPAAVKPAAEAAPENKPEAAPAPTTPGEPSKA